MLPSVKKTASGTLKALEIPDILSKLAAVGSDGASVMFGCNAGVFGLLKEKQPGIIAFHCCGHRLELAYKDTVKNHHLPKQLSPCFEACTICGTGSDFGLQK